MTTGEGATAVLERSAHIADVERRLAERLGTKVSIRDRGGPGRIVIDYYAAEDLARVMDVLLGVDATG